MFPWDYDFALNPRHDPELDERLRSALNPGDDARNEDL